MSNVVSPRSASASSAGLDELAARLVDGLLDYAIILLNPDGTVASWNQGARQLEGYEAGEIIGEPCSRLYQPEEVAAGKPERELELAARYGRCENEGFRLRKDGSRFWASVLITPLRDARGNLLGYGRIMRDLTDRVLASNHSSPRSLKDSEPGSGSPSATGSCPRAAARSRSKASSERARYFA